MAHGSTLRRLIVALTLLGWLASAAPAAFAQDPGTPAPAATGTLLFRVFACIGADGTGALVTDGSAPDPSCTEDAASLVSLTIDGSATDVSSGSTVTVTEGAHDIVEQSRGLSGQVVVAADATATVDILFFSAPAPEPTATATATQAPKPTKTPKPTVGPADLQPVTVKIVTRLCVSSITSETDLNALADSNAKETACPVIELPGDSRPASVNTFAPAGKEGELPIAYQDNLPDFDVSLSFDPGSGTVTKTVSGGDATFSAAAACETDPSIGADVNLDSDQTDCFDASSYDFANVPAGAATITHTPPDGYALIAANWAQRSGDATDHTAPTSPSANATTIDTSSDSDGTVTVELFLALSAPITDRITVMVHNCSDEVADLTAFNGLADWEARQQACPVIVLPGETAPTGAEAAQQLAFGLTVTDTDAIAQAETDATFLPLKRCEATLQLDLNDDGDQTDCIEISGYQFDGVKQGEDVTIAESTVPDGYQFGTVVVDPVYNASSPDAVLESPALRVDTTEFDHLVVHFFNFVIPPTGTLTVIKLWCASDADYVEAVALAPGAKAGPDDLGDASCYADDAWFDISLFGAEAQGEFPVGTDGYESVAALPVTNDTTGQHVIRETSTFTEVAFDISADTATTVIFRNYYVYSDDVDDGGEDCPDCYPEEDCPDCYPDEGGVEEVDDGGDMAETGVGPMPAGSTAPLAALVLGSSLLLGVRGLQRRRRPR